MDMKYYYNDPLSAAWMVKHFKMRLHINGIEFTEEVLANPQNDWGSSPLEIHPDSLHILEAKKLDIRVPKTFDKLSIVDAARRTQDYRGPVIDDEWPIIFRDGKHFFWPQHD